MNKLNIKKQLQKGFTLIELLIVIAVLGVLAAVILVAIDPIEQIARAEDAGRKSQVGQLSSAMQAYLVGQSLATAPAASATWQTMLQNAGEIKSTFTAPGMAATCGPTPQTGYCYAPSGANFVIWTYLESKSEVDKAAGVTLQACATGTTAAYIYSSSQGKAGNACITTGAAPAVGTALIN